MKTLNTDKVFAAACLGMFLFGIVFLSLGTISTFIQQKFSLDPSGAGTLATSLPFGMLAGTILFGPVADRYGYKYLLVVSSLLILISLEMIAFAPTILLLQISYFLIGTGGGIINGATNALAADIATGSKGSKLSLLGVFFGIGALGMPVLTGAMTKMWNYETIISSVGLFLVLPILYFLVIRFPDPKQKQGFPLMQGIRLLRDPLLLLFGFILFFESGMEGMTSNWTTTYLGDIRIPVSKSLYALSVQVAAMVIARLILARLLLKISPARVMYMSLCLILGSSLVLFFSKSFPVVLIAMTLFGFGFAAGFPVILGFTGERYPELSGTAFGIVIIIALIGNTFLNYLTGILSDTVGIRFFPLLLMLSAAIMMLLLWIARRSPVVPAD